MCVGVVYDTGRKISNDKFLNKFEMTNVKIFIRAYFPPTGRFVLE
jgi:hypothetical protein